MSPGAAPLAEVRGGMAGACGTGKRSGLFLPQASSRLCKH